MLVVAAAAYWFFSDDEAAPVAPVLEAAAPSPTSTDAPADDAGPAAVAPSADAREPALFGWTSADGAPVPATVHVGNDVVKAGADGRFAWHGSATGNVVVWAEHEGLRSGEETVTLSSEQPAQVALELFSFVSVVGRITGGNDRKPIAAVRIRFGSASNESVLDGTYWVKRVRAGKHVVELEPPAPWESRKHTVMVTPGRENTFDFWLDASQTIEGTVRNAEGEPVASAVVHLRPPGETELVVTSGTNGRFSFPRVARAPHAVFAQAGFEQSPVVTTAPTRDLVLVVGGGAQLALTVLRDHDSAAGLEVTLTTNRFPPEDPHSVRTGAEGIARFDRLVPRAWVAWARVTNRRWQQLGGVILAPGANAATLRFPDDGMVLHVRVEDAIDSKPVADAQVTFAGRTTATNAEGLCTFDDVGRVSRETSLRRHSNEPELVATAPGHALGRGWIRWWRGPDEVAVVKLSRLRMARGEAAGSDGKPLTRATFDGRPVATSPTGQFQLAIPVSDRGGKSYVSCPWCGRGEVVVPPGTADVDLGRVTVPVGGFLDATVLEPDGRPARFASVVLRSRPGNPQWLTRDERAGPSFLVDDHGHGKFRVPPGKWWAVAVGEGFAPSDHDRCVFDAPSGQTATASMQLREPAYVEGVVTRRGKTVAGHVVQDAEEGMFAHTDGTGSYRLGPLTPGNHHVRPTPLSEGAFIAVSGGQVRTADLAIGARLTVEWIEPLDGPFEAYAHPGRVDIDRPRDRDALLAKAWRVTSDGPTAAFDGIAPGEWTVCIPWEWRCISAVVTVPEDGEARVRLTKPTSR